MKLLLRIVAIISQLAAVIWGFWNFLGLAFSSSFPHRTPCFQSSDTLAKIKAAFEDLSDEEMNRVSTSGGQVG